MAKKYRYKSVDQQRRKRLGRLVRARRIAMGMTQIELADLVGISNKTLFNIECGSNWPSLPIYVDILQELGFPEPPPLFQFLTAQKKST